MNPEYPYQPSGQPQPAPQPSAPGQYPIPGSQPQYQPQPVAPQGYGPQPVVHPSPSYHRGGSTTKWVILTFVFIFTTLASTGFGIWAFMERQDYKTNSDNKVSVAVAEAVKAQADKDADAFEQKEKQPNRQFVGPDDYGRLSFDYPKTWSVYEAKSATSGGTYEAYFNPGVVPTVAQSQQFALHVTIENKDYDKVIDSYKRQISEGALTSSSVNINDQNGTRLEGSFTKDIRGSAVIFKIRDKAVTIRSDADTFKNDFNALIATISFNK